MNIESSLNQKSLYTWWLLTLSPAYFGCDIFRSRTKNEEERWQEKAGAKMKGMLSWARTHFNMPAAYSRITRVKSCWYDFGFARERWSKRTPHKLSIGACNFLRISYYTMRNYANFHPLNENSKRRTVKR